MELASASTSTAVPAARHRGPVAALIAAVIVAAALLFAMPSLAYASEAGGSQQAAESQEILLSSKDSSTSVSKTPDEPKTPPAYTQQDAYESTPQSTGSGVDSVTGAGDSATNSYTPGDDKSSINDKDSDSDSDVASDSSISGTKDTDDSTPNKGDDISDSNKGNDSTADSNGASSGSTDEIATDTNQSAHPTGSDSKADDVIATPGDKGSADQNAGTTSDKTEEVYGPPTPADVKVPTETAPSNSIGTASDNITTQAGCAITIHLDYGFSTKPTLATMESTKVKLGDSQDPIFSNSGSFLFFEGNDGTVSYTAADAVAAGLDRVNSSTVYNFRYGYTLTQWLFVVTQSGAQKVASQSSFSGMSTFANYTNGKITAVEAYPILNFQQKSVNYFKSNLDKISGAGGQIKYANQPVYPEDLATPYNCASGYQWIAKQHNSPNKEATSTYKKGATLGDILNTIYGFRGSTAAYDSTVYEAVDIYETEIKEDLSFTVTFNNGGGTGAQQGPFTYTSKTAVATATGVAGGTLPEASFSRTGYDFLGWSTTNGATTAVIGSAGSIATAVGTPTNGGIYTLYAVWSPKTYTITYAPGATSGVSGLPSAGSATHGSNYTVSSTTPTRSGYKFDGWTSSAGGSVAAGGTISNVTSNITLTAKWIARYTVSYNGNGHNSGTAPATVTVDSGGSTTAAANPFTKTGSTFTGWNTAANGSGTSYAAGATISNITSNIILYAQWKGDPTITFNMNKPTGAGSANVAGMPSNTTVTYNTAYTLPTTTPTLKGYTFAGWKKGNTGSTINAGASAGNITANTEFYAQWTEKTGYSVSFYDAFGQTGDGTQVGTTQSGKKWTDSITLPTAPSKTGYNFAGWFLTKDGNGNGNTGQMSSAMAVRDIWALQSIADTTTSVKLYAKWTEKDRVQVTLNLNGSGASYNGSTSNFTSPSLLNGSSWSIPNYANPTRVGYNFKGWADSASATSGSYNAGHTFTNLTASKTVYAVWAAAPVTFTFQGGHASAVASGSTTATANYGSNLTTLGSGTYTLAGNNFSNWSYTNSSNATATVNASTAIPVANFKITWSGSSEAGTLAGTAMLTANWAPITYNISWNANGGTPTTATNNVNADTPITLPSNPTYAGYTFKGWNTAQNGSGSTITAGGSKVRDFWTLSPSGGTLTAYAQWEENKVIIRFYGDTHSSVKWNDNKTLANGAAVEVGAATGKIYSVAGSSSFPANISTGIAPVPNANYEFNASHGSKWSLGSAAGAALSSGVSTAGVLTVPKTGGLYVNGDYYLTVSPAWIAYTVEYYTQNLTGGGYTKVTTPTGSGTAPFGNTLQYGATAGTSGTTSTYTRSTIAGFTYNPSAPGTTATLTMAASGNVIKLYFDRNSHTVSVSYSGNVPPSMTYVPATQTKKFGETVSLTMPTAPTGYTWSGFKLVSGTGVTNGQVASGNFTMPDSDLVIEGVWGKVKYSVDFKTNPTYGATLVGTSHYNLDFGDGLPNLPTANPKDANSYYFMGWRAYENCTTAGSEGSSTDTVHPLMSPDAILGTADAGTPWTITSNTVFVAEFGRIITIVYSAGAASGAFGSVNGAQTGDTVTQAGTRYSNLQAGWALPMYGGAMDPAADRNAGQPKAAPGYKFVGWEWNDAIQGQTFRALGSYTGSGTSAVFHSTNGVNLPTTIDQSLTFTAIWEETTQHLHFDVTHSNLSGVQGIPTTDKTAKTGEGVTLPQAPSYTAATNPTGYTFLGWTTVSSGYVQGTSPLYTNTFTMTPGERNSSVYTQGDAGYGVTLYPVFRENSVTINYAFGTGASGMGTLSRSSETVNMVNGTVQGATATANAGHTFKGWYSSAACNASDLITTNATLTPSKVGGVFAAATYYALFEIDKFTVTFKVGDHGTWTDGTTTDKTATINYNSTVGSNAPAYKGVTGYGFKHWIDQAGKTYTSLTNVRITADTTFTIVWEPRTGYTVEYNTNGGTPSIANQSVQWTTNLWNNMTTDAKNLKRQGYTFDGWWVTPTFTDSSKKVTTSMTFADGIAAAGITVSGDDPATLPLYAKWDARQITVHFQTNDPSGAITMADKVVTWDDANLLGANETMSAAGYNFSKWAAANNASGYTVTNATKVSDIYKQLYGSTDNTKTEFTLYGIWGQQSFTVKFMNGATELKSVPGLKWTDQIDYFDWAPADGSQRLLGWKYTPAGGTQQTWTSTAGKLPVSAFDGTPKPADGSTFILVADLEANTKWIINFNKVNLATDGSGNVNMATANKLSSLNGFANVGTAIDITSFNSHNYITEFENQNGAGRRADLKGYELKTIAGTKTTSTAGEATSGATITFEVYWVEKPFTVKYDMGKDAQGNPFAGTGSIADKNNVGWTAAGLIPDSSSVSWAGHEDNPKWQYRNSSGTLVTINAGTKISDIMGASDSNAAPITLYALWETNMARLTFNVSVGGSAASADNSINISAGGSKYIDINAVTGTAPTMTATAGAGYKFDGWYKDGVLLTNDVTFTPVKDGTLFSSATYEAKFIPLGSITYTVEHMFEGLDGVYVLDPSLAVTDTKSGQEFSTITEAQAAGYAKTVRGFTYTPGLTGSIERIDSLVDGMKLVLLYKRNAFTVNVDANGAGDHPDATEFTINWPTTGLTQATTTQKFGESLTLPTITAPNGWSFQWSISENGANKGTMAPGATFTMPNAIVDVIGMWKRTGHNVNFVIGSADNNGTLSVVGGTLPFTVDHGKTLSDASASGNATNNIRVTPNTGYSFAGWSYTDPADGTTKTTRDPDSIVINQDMTFTAVFKQTFAVIYHPGAHGGTGFTSMIVAGDDIPTGTKNVNEFPLMIGGTDVTMNAPAAAGYKFLGWSWTRDGQNFYCLAPGATAPAGITGTEADMDFMITSDVNFTALWNAMEFDVIFKLDTKSPATTWTPGGVMAGGTGDYHMTPRPTTGSTVTVLGRADVAKEGNQLRGWAIWTDNGDGMIDDIELGQVVLPGGTFKMPAHAVTLVPVWDFQSLQIHYAIGNGSAGLGTISTNVENITADTGLRANGSVAMPGAGYYFDGWYTDPDCTIPVDPTWEEPTLDGGTRLVPMCLPGQAWVSATYYAKFISDFNSFKIEHYFQGPDGEYTLKKTDTCTHMMTGDTASVLDPNNHAYQYLITDPDMLKGYKFDDGVYGQRLMDTVKADGSTTLKLYYSNVPFKIEYILGQNDAGVDASWTGLPGYPTAVAGSTVNIPGVTLDGMQFAGWIMSWNENGSSNMVPLPGNSFQMPLADVTLTAQWKKINDVIIKFFQNDGNGEVDMNMDETITGVGVAGSTFNVPGDLISGKRPAGYQFNAGDSLVTITLVDGENIARVVYTLLNDYKIIWNANTGHETVTVGGMDLSSVIAGFQPADLPTKMGYTLGSMPNRWNTAADGSGAWLDETMTYSQLAEALLGAGYDDVALMERGLTLYAIWTENDFYKVIYDLNNDKNVNTGLLKPVPDHRNPFTPDPIENVKWTQDGFNLFSDEELDAAPNGYEFAGWNTARDGSGLTITDVTKYFDMSNAIDPKVAQNEITLYAMWKELMIKIEYTHTDGGTIDRVVDYVSAVTGQPMGEGSSAGNLLHSVATAKPGYHFVRWELVPGNARTIGIDENDWDTKDSGSTGTNNEFYVLEPTADGRLVAATYRAVFEKNPTVTINYDVNGGEGEIAPTSQTHGLTTKLHNGTGVKMPHYTLVSWNTEPDGSGTTYKLGQNMTMPEEGMTLYAQWKVNSYKVTVNGRGDDVADVKGGKTEVEWGNTLDPEWIASIKQTPKKGSTFQGWKYTMTDAETGETIEGIVWDLADLPEIVGPIEIDALYETEEVVEPELGGSVLPKTGDADFGWLIALVAGLALVILVLALRRRNEEDEDGDDFTPRKGFKATDNMNNNSVCTPGAVRLFDPVTLRGMRNVSSSCETNPADGGLACAAIAHTTSGLFLSRGAFSVPAEHSVFQGPFSASPDHFVSKGAFSNPTDCFAVKGIFADSITPRSTSFVAPFLGQGYGRVASAHVRKVLVAAVAVLALAVSVAFAPGLALAASDPGSGSAEHITTQSQTQHSTDPATTKTGSFKSSASSSSAQSTKSSVKSSSAASSSANSTSRASSSASAAPQESTSGSGESFTTRIATEHRTASVTYSNAHAHKASMYALNQKQNTSSKTGAVTYSASSRTLGSAFGSASSASAGVGAGVQTASAGASADAGLGAAADSAAESTAVLTVSSLNASAVGSAEVASRLTASNAAGMIAGASASAGNVYGTTTAARVESAPTDTRGQSPASDDATTNAPGETPFDNPRSRSSAYATIVNMSDSSLETLSNKCASENLPFISGCAVVENEARQDEASAAAQEVPSDASITASTSVLAPVDPNAENSDGSSIIPDEPSDSTVTDPDADVENPGDGSGDPAETPDKPTDPTVPDQPDVPDAPDTPDNPDNPDTPDTPDDPEPPAVTDAPVQITYKAGEGGSVSYGSDLISSATGFKLDKNGQPTKEEVNGAAATPDIGYHFTGWTIETPDGTEPISVCDKAALDHWIVKDCAQSKLTGCYKPVSFIANFKCNEYVLDYDGNGGSLGGAVVPTQATFGNDDALKSAAAPQKEGHEFLCWNTNAAGTGVSVHEGELLSEQLLRSMVRTSSIEDSDGAGIKLYALWNTAAPVEEPDVPVTPVDPVTPVTPAPRPSQPVVEQPASSAANRAPVAAASQVAVADTASTSTAALAEEGSAEADQSALLGFTERIGDIGNILSFAPIAGLLPTVEPFITMSAEALAGIGDGATGVSPAEGTRAIGSVATAAGVIALAAGIAGAASTSLARRRALRSLSEPFTKE